MLDQNLEGVPQKVRLPHPSEVQNKKGVAGLIFELGPWNFSQILIFWRSSNEIYIHSVCFINNAANERLVGQ